MSSYVCSASMINNTAEDCTPYILSAWHCGEPNAGSNINTWVWYWNYQKTSCMPNNNGSNPSKGSQSMTGGTVVASSGNGTLNNPPGTNQVAGSDFYLVELNSQPPAAYNAYYAGWNRTNTASPSGVGVHHPAGSAKKISTYTAALTNATYNGGANGAHWRVTWAATANGHGVTEGGSSGSPIYNNNGRIMGQLSGGSSFCSTPTAPDLYGKMFTNWTAGGSSPQAQLAPWLDPINSGVTILDGAYEPCNVSNPPTCGINASATSILEGGTVNFTDGSSGNPTTWAWDFDNTSLGGVSPATSTSQNPGAVTFANAGTYEVELIATNANGSCTTTVNIIVSQFSGCDTLLNINDTNSLTIYGTAQGGFITGNNGYGDLAKAELYSGYAGTHVTGSDVFIFGLQDGGNNSTFDLTIWDDNAGLPGNIIGQVSYLLTDIQTAFSGGTQGVIFLPFNAPVPVNGNDFYIGIDMSNFGVGDTLGIVSKYATVNVPTNSSFEQWGDNTWHDMESAWGAPFSMYITAHVTDAPVSGTASAPTTACVGETVTFSYTGTNVTGQTWFHPSGTPAQSTTATSNVVYNTPGTYMTYVFLEGSCSGQYLDSVQVIVTDGPSVSATSTDPSCAGNDGTITITATGGSGPYQYSIDGGTNFAGTANFTGLTQGTYNIEVQDANGCSSTDVVTINANSGSLIVTSTGTNSSCANNDGSITITATSGTPAYQYSIDGGANFFATNSFTGLAAGTYNIVVNDNNGCQGTSVYEIDQNITNLFVSSNNTNPSCGGTDGIIEVTVSGGVAPYTYSIDGTNYVTSNIFSGLGVNSYVLNVLDANGCQGSFSTQLVNTAGPTASANGTNVSCGGLNDGSVVVSGTGGTTPYTYSIDGTNFGTNNTFTGIGAGTITAYVLDAGGCQSTATVTITEPTAVLHTVNVTDASCGLNNGSITVTATGGSGTYTYSLDGNTPQANNVFNNLGAGSYTITAIDGNGCSSNITTHTVGGGVAISITSTVSNETCLSGNGSITANVTGGTSPYSYTLNGGSSQSTPVFSGLSAGSYQVAVSDVNGCAANTTTIVTNTGGFTLNVNPAAGQTICQGNTANISASGAGVGATYTWDQSLPVGASHNVNPTVTTTYTVVAEDAQGCTATGSTTVNVETIPTITVIPTNPEICSGESVNLTATGAQSYVWNTGQTTSTISVSPTNQTTYTVIGQNGSCSGSPVQVTVAVAPSPTVNANSDVINIPVGGTVNFNNSGSNATSYEWNFGDGQTSTTGFVAHTYNVQGVYTVTLTGTIGNCTATDVITINVGVVSVDNVDLDQSVSLYPNPNNGLFNLKLEFNQTQDAEITLFTSLGQIVDFRRLENVDGQIEIFDVSNLSNGVYFINVKTQDGIVSKRFILSK